MNILNTIIIRAYQTIDQFNNSEGPAALFQYSNSITGGLFSRLLLFAIFMIIMLGSFFSQRRIDGNEDMAGSAAMAGFITSGAAIILSFIPGMVTTADVVITISITIVMVLWLLTSKSSN